MRTPGILIFAAILLAGCAHQPPPPRPVLPQASPPGAGDASQGNALLAATTATAEDQAADEEEEPRIIRGNDRMYGTIPSGPGVDGPPVSLKFEEAPLVDVVRSILGDVLKVDYTLHPPISGAITMSTSKEVPPDQAVFLLEIALQANGMAMGRDARGTWHVGSIQAIQAMSPSLRMASPGSKIKLPPGTGPIIVPLHYVGAGEMASILGAFVPPEAIVRVDTMRNMLILAGNRSQAEGWLDIVATFDVDLLAGMSVGIFPLKYVTAQEVQEALALVTGGASPSAGAGVAPGTAGGRPASPAQPATATASTAAAVGSAVAASGMGNPLAGAVRIMPLERINSVLVVTPRAAYLDQAREWIEKLDRPSANNAEPQLFVYPVQNGNAAHLAGLVSSIFGGTGSTSGSSGVAPGLGSSSGSTSLGNRGTGSSNTFSNRNTTTSSSTTGLSSTGTSSSTSGRNSLGGQNQPGSGFSAFGLGDTVRVIADELNNAILVYSTPAEYEKIEIALKRLDIPPVQVLIEASIVEVTLSNNLEYGLQWAFKDWFDNASYQGWGSLGNGALSDSVISSGFSYVLTRGDSVRAALSMLASESLLKIISSPSLMVLDNHEASINVGNETPVLTGTTTTTSGNTVVSNNVQWKPTGVQLSILPSVNAGDMVTLQLSQSVTELGEEDPIVNQRGFLTREIDTKVAVRSGETLVLGGLIRDSSTDGNGGIPFLKDIPVIGKLFGTTTKSGERNELIVIITPRVVRSDEQIRQLSRELSSRVKGLRRIEAKKLPPYMYEFTDEVQQPDPSALPDGQEQNPAPAQTAPQ